MNSDQNCGFLMLQSDWNCLISDGSNFWITWKKYGNSLDTKHGNITVKHAAGNKLMLDCNINNVQMEMISAQSAFVKTPQFLTKFIAPIKEFNGIHQKSIASLDISGGGGLGVSTSFDGKCKIWDTAGGLVRRELEGHLGDVHCCKFFPSGLVVLTGGMDTQLKIWSAENGDCARTLNGSHKGAVLCVDVVDRGRNIVSGSRDGTILLWECGSGSCIGTIGSGSAAVNCCSITNHKELSVEEFSDRSPLEVGTEGKLIAVAFDDGELKCYALQSRKLLLSLHHTAALNTCCFANENIIIAGSQDGTILVADIHTPSDFIIRFQPVESPVQCVSPSQNGFWVACSNGRCSLYQLTSQDGLPNSRGDNTIRLELKCELTGPDCDPVYAVIESSNNFVYTSCRDGIVRKYKVK